MHGKFQFYALRPFIHNNWRHTLWHRPNFCGTCYWPVVLQHLLSAEAWGSQGHSVTFQVLSRLVPKNKKVLSHSLQLSVVLNCPPVYCLLPLDLQSLLLSPHFLLSLIWTCLLSGLLRMLHAWDPYWLLLEHPVPCTPVQGVPSAFKAVDKPVCACRPGTEHTGCMHCHQLHAPAQWTHRFFVPHYCRSFTDWHSKEHWPC